MKKILNRNHLKIIALVTMLIDHIGYVFFPEIIWLRIIGRVAFPIFAFFVAQGYTYTHSKQKYIISLLTFGLLSQIPYILLFQNVSLNILFTFLASIGIIYLIEQLKKDNKNILLYCIFVLFNLLLIFATALHLIDYGIFGVYLVVMFYFVKDPALQQVWFVLLNIGLILPSVIYAPLVPFSYVQLATVLALPLIFSYNNKKGKTNLKYLFYIFYPIHLLILYFIQLLLVV